MKSKNRRKFLRMTAKTAGMAAALSVFPPSIRKALSIPAVSATGTIDDVQHVVILMQENRSFDHYFGTLRGVRGFRDRVVVPLPGGTPIWNQPDGKGGTVRPFHFDTRTTSAQKVHYLPHSWQDAQGASHNGRWDQWVPHKTSLTMGHYRREDIPFQFALADAFTICDSYHCSIHGQTAPNRIFLWAGGNDPRATGGGPVIDNASGLSLDIVIDAPPGMENYGQGPRYTYATYPERLEKAGITWKIYQDPKDNYWGLMNACVAFDQYNAAASDSPLRQKGMSRWTLADLRRDVMNGTLPQVTWICPTMMQSEHPNGSSPIEGANFTQQVLDALTANPDVWSKTVLFLTFDENDGFFDHVAPPSPPPYNADGSRAGLSTVDTTDDIHAADKLPYGLGVRVPMYVISPWSRGGWVNSQVFDHTSIIRFLEKRFGVIEPNITAWRRAVCGDLTSAFDFASPNTAPLPSLPDTSQAAAIVKTQGKRPPPAAPATPERLFQEPGTRRSRALPYEAHVHARVDGGNGTVSLTFRNTGQAAMVFHVYDKLHPERVPRVYTVETGKTLIDHWDTGLLDAGAYDLWICGVNGYCRAFKGNVHAASGDANPEVDIEYDVASRAIRLKATNTGQAACVLTIRPNAYRNDGPGTLSVAPGMEKEWQYSLTDSGNWYDLTVTGDNRRGFVRRFAGRMEIGAHGVSDPAMA